MPLELQAVRVGTGDLIVQFEEQERVDPINAIFFFFFNQLLSFFLPSFLSFLHSFSLELV